MSYSTETMREVWDAEHQQHRTGARMTKTASETTPARAPGTVPALVGCPFCGGTRVRHVRTALKYERQEWRRVKCDDCGAYGPIKDNEPEAKTAWNHRAPNDKLTGQQKPE